MKQKRAYEYRIYPTPDQKRILARTFGCVRYVYNWALRYRTDAYYQRQARVYYADTSAAFTALRRHPETIWLGEVAYIPCQQSLGHLDTAFKNFFEGRAKYPKFKKKHGPQAARVHDLGFYLGWNHPAACQDDGAALDSLEPSPARRMQANHHHGDQRPRRALLCLLLDRRGPRANADLA